MLKIVIVTIYAINCNANWDYPDGHVSFISVIDLIIFKIHSCGLRAEKVKRSRDANDAEALLVEVIKEAPLTLTTAQADLVEIGIPDVVKNGKRNENWWRKRLGLSDDASSSNSGSSSKGKKK